MPDSGRPGDNSITEVFRFQVRVLVSEFDHPAVAAEFAFYSRSKILIADTLSPSDSSRLPESLNFKLSGMLDDLSLDDLHLKFRSIMSLIPIVAEEAGVSMTAPEGDMMPQPRIDDIVPPETQRVLDWLATVLVVDREVVAVTVEEKEKDNIGVLVSAHVEIPAVVRGGSTPCGSRSSSRTRSSSQTRYLVGPNPRYKDGKKKKGKNRTECHGWEAFGIRKPHTIVDSLDVMDSSLYALRMYTKSM